jgi:CheY-like chemotaxis protein
MKVLVVEDEELLRAVAVQALEDAGFQVIEAASGEEAMSKCQETLIALFTDIRLPGKFDGWDIAEHCRNADPKLPVVYATAYSNAKPRPVPGSRYFSKPYRLESVVQAICELSEGRPARLF